MAEGATACSELSLFYTLISSRRFDYHALQVLESILTSRDVKSLSHIRSSLRSVLRSQSISAIEDFRCESLEKKLSVLEFFVQAFSLAGDVESCLAMRYEALVLRDLKAAKYPWAQVLPEEWLTFAEQSLDNGFYSNAAKACEYALSSCKKMKDDDVLDEDKEFTNKVKKLRDTALTSASSGSVQAQAAEYLRKKTITNRNKRPPPQQTDLQLSASELFKNAIKKRHVRLLHEHQSLGSHTESSQVMPQ